MSAHAFTAVGSWHSSWREILDCEEDLMICPAICWSTSIYWSNFPASALRHGPGKLSSKRYQVSCHTVDRRSPWLVAATWTQLMYDGRILVFLWVKFLSARHEWAVWKLFRPMGRESAWPDTTSWFLVQLPGHTKTKARKLKHQESSQSCLWGHSFTVFLIV
jgi:hypothetical protein